MLIRGTAAPGTFVNVNSGQYARPAQPRSSTQFMVVGTSFTGPPNKPVTLTGFADAALRMGGLDKNSRLMDALYAYFNLFPGDRAVGVRVVGPAATVATVTIKDRGVGVAQKDTLKIEGKYPSADHILYEIADGTNPNTFKLIVESPKLGVSRVYNNLRMDAESIAAVNQDSDLVKLINMNSTNAAPTNLPVVTAKTALVGGTDDFANISDTHFIGTDTGTEQTGLRALDSEEFGPGQIAIPGATTQAVHAALIASADSFKRLALLDLPLGSTKDSAKAARQLHGSAYAAMYFPQVEMFDFGSSGLRRFYPPSGFVAGACALKEQREGVHAAPANVVIPGALNVETYSSGASQMTGGTLSFLTEHQLNGILPLPAQGVKIYGERVISAPGSVVQMAHETRVVNSLYYDIKDSLQGIPFRTIDGTERLFREVASVCRSVCRRMYERGGLFGRTESEAFMVVCDRNNNSNEDLDAQRLNVKVEVRPSPTSERVNVNLDQRPLTFQFNQRAA